MNISKLFKNTIDVTLELIFEPQNESYKVQFLKYINTIFSIQEFDRDKELQGLKDAVKDFIFSTEKFTTEHLQQILEILGKLKEFFEKDITFKESQEILDILKILDGDLKPSFVPEKDEDIEIIRGSEEKEISESDEEELREIFIDDLSEQFRNLDDLLLELEAHPDKSELINNIFRLFHSIKGSGTSLGYKEISKLAHRIEDTVGLIRDGEETISAAFFDLMFNVSDNFKNIIIKLKNNESSTDEISEIYENIKIYEAASKEDIIEPIAETSGDDYEIAPVEETIRIKLEKIDKLIDLSSEMLVSRGFFSDALENLINIRNSFYEKIDEFQTFLEDHRDTEYSGVVSSLEDSISKLTGSIEKTTDIFSSKLEHFFFMSNAVQDEILKVRMVPFSSITGVLRRTVRDLSKEQNKNIDLIIEGLYTELDKRVLELLKDPLMHIIRNAVDHGIEPEEERIKSGKNKLASIKISTLQKGSQVEISVEDDGRGINSEIIKQTAVDKKIISKDKAEILSPSEIIYLIFRPGFSSKKDISDVSGRGVGLDVVSNNIRELHGMISVKSKLKAGTKFTMTIPLTLAISPSLVFILGNFRLAIISNLITKVYRLKNNEKIRDPFFLQINSTKYPIINLHKIFNLDNKKIPEYFDIIILGTDEKGIGIIIDEFVQIQELIIKPFGKIFNGVKHLSGCAVDETGEMIYFLDVNEITEKGLSEFYAGKNTKDLPVFTEESLSLYESLKFLTFLHSSKENQKSLYGLSFLIKDNEFIFESSEICRILKKTDISEIDYKANIIRINGSEMSFIDLRKLITKYDFKDDIFTTVIVLEKENKNIAFIVDHIKDFGDFPVERLKKLKLKNKIADNIIIYKVT